MSKKNALSELLEGKEAGQEKEQHNNTAIQHTGNTAKNKKATFLFDNELHKELKVFAASRGVNMVDIVESAVKEYLQKHR